MTEQRLERLGAPVDTLPAARRGKLLLGILNDFAADFAATVEGTDLKRSPAPAPMATSSGGAGASADGLLRQPMGAPRATLESAREKADADDALRELRGGARIAFILDDLFCTRGEQSGP